MKLLTWNVGHRTRRREIPVAYADALTGRQIDVITLTEYVHVEESAFVARLRALGYHTATSAHVQGQNQILIASRPHCDAGNVECDHEAKASPSNWLQVRIDSLDVVALRVPIIKERGGRAGYWHWLTKRTAEFETRPAVLLGDFNARHGYRPLEAVQGGAWRLVTPSDGWSFRNSRGNTFCIDHALVNDHVGVVTAVYEDEIDGMPLAGAPNAYSDHAALIVEVES